MRKFGWWLLVVGVMGCVCFTARAQQVRAFTLVIDAGHGGHDAGAVGKYSKEKDINLNVALAFGRMVERNNPDVRVIYTRKTDVFVPLQERANMANRAKADLFISIHTNSLPKGRIAYGSETYTLGMARAEANLDVAKRENSVILYEKDYKQRYSGFDPNQSESYIIFEFMQDQYMKQSVNLARCIQRSYVKNAGRKDKGVHQAGFLVLRNTSMPSVLTELGFISTPSEEAYLNSREGVQQLGASIYEGFLAYKENRQSVRTLIQPFRPDEPEEKVARADKRILDEAGSRPEASAASTDGKPVFKVQILASDRRLSANHPQLKGQEGVACYEEGGLYKYTCGESHDFAEMMRLRRTLLDKFPQAFVVAFIDGKRTDVQAARRAAARH